VAEVYARREGSPLDSFLKLTDGRGKGIPKDARFKPGSGGQLIAFVPSLDLVVTRQTGETVLPGSGSQTGGVKVADLNHDGQITAVDQKITGNPNPSYIFGFATSLKYKKFDLGVFFAGSQGNRIYNLSRYTFENPLGHRNVFAALVNRWSTTNPSNSYIIPLQGGRLPVSDRFVEDGSYIRCKNITLGYTLPAIKGIHSIRLYASVNNVFLITKYGGFDPEVNSYGNSNTQIGIDNLVYPSARSFLGGLQVNF